jgi:hypothetical protein
MAAPSFETENKNASASRGVGTAIQKRLAAGEVHGDFKADTQVGVSGFGPGHGSAPSGDGTVISIHIVHLQPEMVQIVRLLCYSKLQ